MSDTPKTDAFVRQIADELAHPHWIEFARELERENTVLRAALEAQMKYQRDLRADRDRIDWLTSFHGSVWLRLYLDMNDTLTRNQIDRRMFTEELDADWRK